MISVEPASAADIDALIKLESALFIEDAGVHDPHADTTWPQREGRKDFEELLGSADSLLLMAKQDQAAIGFLAGYATKSSPTRQPVEYAILRSIYVDLAARRLGAARQLSEHFIGWARDRGCVEAHVDHYAANAGAASLYGDLGFAPRSIARSLTLLGPRSAVQQPRRRAIGELVGRASGLIDHDQSRPVELRVPNGDRHRDQFPADPLDGEQIAVVGCLAHVVSGDADIIQVFLDHVTV